MGRHFGIEFAIEGVPVEEGQEAKEELAETAHGRTSVFVVSRDQEIEERLLISRTAFGMRGCLNTKTKGKGPLS